MESTELHERIWENGHYLKQGLKELGFNIGESETPITPCIIGDENQTQNFSKTINRRRRIRKINCFPNRSKRNRTCSQYAYSCSYERNA